MKFDHSHTIDSDHRHESVQNIGKGCEPLGKAVCPVCMSIICTFDAGLVNEEEWAREVVFSIVGDERKQPKKLTVVGAYCKWSPRVRLDATTRECLHNEPSFLHIGTPHFLSLHPRSTRRFYSLYKHDQSQRKARTGTIYQGTVGAYWSLDLKESVDTMDFVTTVCRKDDPEDSSEPIEVTKLVQHIWRKRVIENAFVHKSEKPAPTKRKEPNFTYEESSLIYAWFPPPVLEEKPRRLSGHMSREEMKRVLMSEESLREISAHVAKMLHVYSIQEQGGEQETHWGTWNKKSKWGKREMDDMVMSFVVGRPRSVDANGNQQQPSGLHAVMERIDLDGRKRNLTPTFQETVPFRYTGVADGLIRVVAKWIAASCKERELWWAFRDMQMSADQNAVRTEAVERDLDKLYKWDEETDTWSDEETAACDRAHTDVLNAALFDDDTLGDTTTDAYDAVADWGPDMRPTSVRKESDWEYPLACPCGYRSGGLQYVGPPLVNVPWWESSVTAPSQESSCHAVEKCCAARVQVPSSEALKLARRYKRER